MRFSLKRSPGNAFPKLNVEGSNPFARFGGDGWRGCGGGCAGRDVAGAKSVPCLRQALTSLFDSTRLPAVRE